MHGVPSDLPVQALVGRVLTHIGLALHHIQLHFDQEAHIGIEGAWQLRDRSGYVIDQDIDPPSTRKSYQLHRLLMQSVTAVSLNAPRSFTVSFANGDALTILDESPQFESFSFRIN